MMVVEKTALEELREVCEVMGIEAEDKITFIVRNNDFSPYIKDGDTLIIDRAKKPTLGDFTIISHNGKYQLVQISGRSFIGNDIVIVKCSEMPLAKELLSPKYVGTVVAHIKNNRSVGEKLGKITINFPQQERIATC